MISRLSAKRRFSQLSESEILALAISQEEDDAHIYRIYAGMLRREYPAFARVFDGMAREEDSHRKSLIDMHRRKFGELIPLVRREHVSGFHSRGPVWLTRNLGVERIRREAERMERQSRLFYLGAAKLASDAGVRELLGDLAAVEEGHGAALEDLQIAGGPALGKEIRKSRRQLILTWIQPGLAGLMDGSVSTLAPIFATAFATQDTWTTFLVGLAASVGAGISMGFTEAISDDGQLSGRGSPVARGMACGVMTAVGGLGHALPYLISDFWTATALAICVVFVELWAIAWIQSRYMETPFFRAALQVVLGGSLVFAAGMLIGQG